MDWFACFCVFLGCLLAAFLPGNDACDLSGPLPERLGNIVMIGDAEPGHPGHAASHRSFVLPTDADLENITASEKNGVITIIVPRKA